MRRVSFALPLVVLVACGPRYRNETLGTAYANGDPIHVSAAGQHRIDWRVQTPRALRFAWTVECGGAQASGAGGETFEQYKARRIAEIRAQREEQKKAVGALVGAVGASADVQTPEGEGRVEAGVDGQAVANAVVSDDVELPAGDFGAGTYGGTITVFATQAGDCRMNIGPEAEGEDLRGISASYQVTRVIDIAAEKAQIRAERHDAAIAVRGSISARLVSGGADPELRARLEAQAQAEALARREEELRVRAEIDAKAQAEQAVREAEEARVRADRDAKAQAELEVKLRIEADARAKAEAEAEARAEAEAEARGRVIAEAETRNDFALNTRTHILNVLIGYGADAGLRARLEAEAEARVQAEAELRAQAEAELRLRRQQEDARRQQERNARERADAEMRARVVAEGEARVRIALELRTRISGVLVGYGADPDYRHRQQEAEIAARVEADARAQAEWDAQEAAHARVVAERDRRVQAAFAVRGQITAYLLMLGAIEKPPMPEAPYEDPGEPVDGAVWVAGEWVWQDAQWVWISGGWTFPDDGFSVSVHVGNDERPVVVDHREETGSSTSTTTTTTTTTTTSTTQNSDGGRVKVQDHRDEPKKDERPKVQDHRDEKKDEPKEDRVKVRDHRR